MIRRAVTAVVLAGSGALAPVHAIQTAERPPGRILVVPFENVKREGSIFWLGEASALLLTDNLNAFGLSPITRAERQQAFERLQVPPAAVLTDATVIRIAQIVGAAHVIIGSLQLDPGGLVVRARNLELDSGRVQADVTERGPVADLFAIFDRVSRRLADSHSAALPASPVEPERPRVAAFESFVKGLLAETPATAIKYLNAALTRFPRYDRVRLALWDAYVDQGDHQRALSAVQGVPAASPSARRARFLSGVSQMSLLKYDDAFGTFKALSDQEPAPTVLNNLGVVQMRRGGNWQSGLPTSFFEKAAKADPDDSDYFFNLGYGHFQARDNQAAIYWLREAVRRDPADGDAHFVLGAALSASGNNAESAREKELARRLSSTYETWEKRPPAEQVPKGLERVKNNEIELPHARRIEARLTGTGQRDQAELAGFYLDRARRLFQQENDRQAVGDLERVLYLSPYLADAHLLLGRIHLRNGRVREAIDALKISLWSAETEEAHTVLADAYIQAKEIDQARAEAQRALSLNPSSTEASRLLGVLKSP